MKKEILKWIVAIAVAIALTAMITKSVGKSYSIKGDSVDPALKDGEHVVVNTIGYKLGGVEKGNVIVFHANKKDDYVKRVIGTPGDSVEYKNDAPYVDGKKQLGPYLNYNEKRKQTEYITGNFKTENLSNTNSQSNVIPKGRYLVLGDNREVSKDSRPFGLIDKDQIVGKVLLRYWPFSEFKSNFNPNNTKN